MPVPRSQLISLQDTPWYHCVSRCVRRAWLCGFDDETNTDYEYRREWIVERLQLLSQAFAIEVAAYCVMSNHHHQVLRVLKDKALAWSDDEVITRWHKVYKGNFVSQRYLDGSELSKSEKSILNKDIPKWRERLYDISWFMRALNEPIARRANAEDQYTGKFFEARFKSQALLDEKAILACMAYVDLNPIRAGMVETPEQSEFTSITERIDELKLQSTNRKRSTFLSVFNGNEQQDQTSGVPYSLKDYVELVDWTGRAVRDDKTGYISHSLPTILSRLGLTSSEWTGFATSLEENFGNWVGSGDKLRAASRHIAKTWICAPPGSRKFY